MLMGAFSAVVGAWASGSSLVGVGLALLGGAAIGVVVAIVTVRYRADNMVTGLTANIVAAGLTSYCLRILSGAGRPVAIHLTPLPPWPIPGLADLPVVGPVLFALPPLTYLAIAGCIALEIFLRRTQAGLTLRATGENPEAVFASGVDPMQVRIIAVVACGAVAGLGGAVLSLQQVGTFTDGMTGGRGYLALASLIVARWNPLGAALACLAFGAAEAFELRLQSFGVPVSSYVVQMAPYLIALAVLAGLGRTSRMPASIGQPLSWDR
jgi:general nucleoside transport system permease protein